MRKKFEALDGKGFSCEIFMDGNLKKEPTVYGKVITKISSGNQVMVIEYVTNSNGYFKVLYEDKLGYLNDLYLKSFPEKDELKKIGKPYVDKNKSSKKSETSVLPKSNSRSYYTGPRGGCYYYNGSGKKQYVSRSYCN